MALAAALAAGGALLAVSPTGREGRPAPAGALMAATAWPRAQRADLPGRLPDGTEFFPEVFLDAYTVVGTAPSTDGRFQRLLHRSGDGSVRELRRLPQDRSPYFDNLTVGASELAWTESTSTGGLALWAVRLGAGSAPRQLTVDTGDALFYGSQYDMVIAEGRLTWLAASPAQTPATEVRSISLAGGDVTVRDEPGLWELSAWPWLADGVAEKAGTTRLRNMATRQEIVVPTTGAERAACSPAWCRVLVLGGEGLARIDLMRPDGTDRRRMAGSLASAALRDVAPLDRFVVLSEGGPESDPDAPVPLFGYDITTGRTVDIGSDVSGVAHHGGVLWWATGEDALTWHTIDLRTV